MSFKPGDRLVVNLPGHPHYHGKSVIYKTTITSGVLDPVIEVVYDGVTIWRFYSKHLILEKPKIVRNLPSWF